MTLAVTILVSAVVSLTLTPDDERAAAAPPAERAARLALSRPPSASSSASIARYATTLRWVLRHQLLTLMVTLLRSPERCCSTSSCRRASFRCRIQA